MKIEFEDIDKARRLLGLGEEATLREIKQAFYKVARMYHPDKCGDGDLCLKQKYKEISSAYDLLLRYCRNYKYSFKKEDVQKQYWGEEIYKRLKQFYDGWWGEI